MLERHVKEILKTKHPQVIPISVILLVTKVGNGQFNISRQADAQEFLYRLLDNLTLASFGNAQIVPASYER